MKALKLFLIFVLTLNSLSTVTCLEIDELRSSIAEAQENINMLLEDRLSEDDREVIDDFFTEYDNNRRTRLRLQSIEHLSVVSEQTYILNLDSVLSSLIMLKDAIANTTISISSICFKGFHSSFLEDLTYLKSNQADDRQLFNSLISTKNEILSRLLSAKKAEIVAFDEFVNSSIKQPKTEVKRSVVAEDYFELVVNTRGISEKIINDLAELKPEYLAAHAKLLDGEHEYQELLATIERNNKNDCLQIIFDVNNQIKTIELKCKEIDELLKKELVLYTDIIENATWSSLDAVTSNSLLEKLNKLKSDNLEYFVNLEAKKKSSIDELNSLLTVFSGNFNKLTFLSQSKKSFELQQQSNKVLDKFHYVVLEYIKVLQEVTQARTLIAIYDNAIGHYEGAPSIKNLFKKSGSENLLRVAKLVDKIEKQQDKLDIMRIDQMVDDIKSERVGGNVWNVVTIGSIATTVVGAVYLLYKYLKN